MDYHVVQAEDSDEWYDGTCSEIRVSGFSNLVHAVVLNQCNITGGSNNNKYYRIQLVKDNSAERFYCWQKWGRVGEPARGSSAKFEGPFPTVEKALKPFCKKFRDKTGNVFGSGTFVPKSGKYTLIEIDNDVEVDEDLKMPAVPDVEYLPSKLDVETKDLIEVLFSKDMRNEALTSFNLDLKKLPLGVPSQQQIQHGVTILDEIKDKLNGNRVTASYDELSSQFYTAIPHSFGRSRPPTIKTSEALQSRYDMCDILSDMYTTNETCRKIATEAAEKKQVPALVDQHYDSLHAELSLVDQESEEFSFIQTYFDSTKQNTGAKIYNVWRVEREGEKQRHERYKKLDNRKLLWHGTNVAVVAPILTSGLRIMPHSGGRVGSGIYLANMQEKSAFYTSSYGSKYACMFLAEAALGKEFIVNADGSHASQLKTAPSGHDSVHAVGRVGPTEWKEMTLEDGTKVNVPQGKGKASEHQSSTFHHDEHLCYDEAQVRLRYVLTVRL